MLISFLAMSKSTSDKAFLTAQQCTRNRHAFYEEEEDKLNLKAPCPKCRCPKGDHRLTFDDSPLTSRERHYWTTLEELAENVRTAAYYAAALGLSPSPVVPSRTLTPFIASRKPSLPILSKRSVSSSLSSLPSSTSDSSSLSSVDEASAPSHTSEIAEDDDEEEMDEEEKKEYTTQDKAYDSDPEGDKTPEGEHEDDDDEGEEENDDDDDDAGFVQHEEDEDYEEDEEVEVAEESPSSNLVLTNSLSDITSGERKAKSQAFDKITSPLKEKVRELLISAAAKPATAASRQSTIDLTKMERVKKGLSLPSSQPKRGTDEQRVKGTSHPAPTATQMRVKQSKKPPPARDMLRFIKIADGTTKSRMDFPADFNKDEWLVYRKDQLLTGESLAQVMIERSSTSAIHKQMVLSKLKLVTKAMSEFVRIRDQRNKLFIARTGECTWPFPQRPLTQAEVYQLNGLSSSLIKAYENLEIAASAFSTVEVSKLIADESSDVATQIVNFVSELPDDKRRLFSIAKVIGFGDRESARATFSSCLDALSSSSSSSDTRSQTQRSVQTSKKKGETSVSVKSSDVIDPATFYYNEEEAEAFLKPSKFESVDLRLSKGHEQLDEFKEKHGEAVEVEATLEEPCPKPTHKLYQLIRLCPMRKDDFNVIDTSKHARAYVVFQQNNHKLVLPSKRCHLCSLPSFWHLQAPTCSLPHDQRENVNGSCKSCGHDITHEVHSEVIARQLKAAAERRRELRERKEKRKETEVSSAAATPVAQQPSPSPEEEEEAPAPPPPTRRSQRKRRTIVVTPPPEKAPAKRGRNQSTSKKNKKSEKAEVEMQEEKEEGEEKYDNESIMPEQASDFDSSHSSSTSLSDASTSSSSTIPSISLLSSSPSDEQEELLDYENLDENFSLSPDTSSVPRMSMMRFTKSSSASKSASTSSVNCPLYIEDLLLVKESICNLCKNSITDHPQKSVANATVSAHPPKVPKESELPVFKDPAKKDMADPELFVQRFEECIQFFQGMTIPLKKLCFRRSLREKYLNDWATACIDQDMPWAVMKREFIKMTSDPAVVEQRKKELQDRKQKSGESVFKYTSEFIQLATRLHHVDTDAHLIEHMYRGLQPNIRKQVTFQRDVQAIAAGVEPTRKYHSLKDLAEAAIMAERVLKQGTVDDGRSSTPRASTFRNNKRKKGNRNRSHSPSLKQAKLNDGSAQAVTSTPTPSTVMVTPPQPRTKKLETVDGKPTNVNKKKKAVSFAPAAAAPTTDGTSTRRCMICGKQGHATRNCYDNKKLCRNCGDKGHTLAECPMPRQSVCRVPVPSLSTLIDEGKKNRRMLVTGPLLGSKPHLALYDTGAMFSGISARLCKQQNLPITSPTRGGDQILGATHGMSTKRIGIVVIEVIIHFSNAQGKAAMKCTKEFEVLNLSDEHFIIGQDLSPDLFPDEEAWKFGAKMADYMTSRPSNIVHLTPNRPRAAALNDVTSESEADSSDEGEKGERVKAIVSNLHVDDDESDELATVAVPLTQSE